MFSQPLKHDRGEKIHVLMGKEPFLLGLSEKQYLDLGIPFPSRGVKKGKKIYACTDWHVCFDVIVCTNETYYVHMFFIRQ